MSNQTQTQQQGVLSRAVANYKASGLLNLIEAFINTYIITPLAALLYPILIGSILEDFKRKEAKATNKVEFAMNYNYLTFNIKPEQNLQELSELVNELKQLKPTNVLEIGTYKGGTLFSFASSSDSIKKSISIGLPATAAHEKCRDYRDSILGTFTKNGSTYLLSEDSHNKSTLNNVKTILNGEKLDFVFIDGEHSFKSVEEDFRMYGHLVKKGGIIAFHDIADRLNKKIDVYQFWDIIKLTYKYKEICHSKNKWGIGILYV